jgi:hypothetical protein
MTSTDTEKNIVHVIGTGTIGEPLVRMLLDKMDVLGFDEVTFNKRTPLLSDRSKVFQLIKRGAILSTDKAEEFEELGMFSSFTSLEAIQRATVVIDCTPGGVGLENKEDFYRNTEGPKLFIAQGSEKGFGNQYAFLVNDETLHRENRFLQVVSCNTHSLSAILHTIGGQGKHIWDEFLGADFTCIRRTNDVSQSDSFCPGLSVGKHGDKAFGTHHARDLFDLMETKGVSLGTEEFPDVYSSACKIPSQYMHGIRFDIHVENADKDEILNSINWNPLVAVTHKTDSNEVFSFGRDQGLFGRILNQVVINTESVSVRELKDGTKKVSGFCFTPQDGNSLLSSIAAATWAINPSSYVRRIFDAFEDCLFKEV